LEATGRRPEALAVYDAGRRLVAHETGLELPAELQAEFEQLLADERRSTRRTNVTEPSHRGAPLGSLETAIWLSDVGDTEGALQLALRGAWWWLSGPRTRARALFEDLLPRIGEPSTTSATSRDVLAAQAWSAALSATDHDAVQALHAGERALGCPRPGGWTDHDALAATVLAERLFERGEASRGSRLLRRAGGHYRIRRNEWGLSLCRLVKAHELMLGGCVDEARVSLAIPLAFFERFGDCAGTVKTLDLMGYCAEIQGDLETAADLHSRALALSESQRATEWIAKQTTRLGSVHALQGRESAVRELRHAVEYTEAIGSEFLHAFAWNSLGTALWLTNQPDQARDAHHHPLTFYERTDSRPGLSYTHGRLAMLADRGGGTAHAQESLRLARLGGDPLAVAHGLESIAMSAEQPVTATRALAAATAIRTKSRAVAPYTVFLPMRTRHQDLATQLGKAFQATWDAAYDVPLRELLARPLELT